jgi:WD40 repeat protein
VFLSYAREDRDFAERQLTKGLAERGKDVWMDVQDIRGGASDWRANVWAAIEASTVVVFVLTPDSLASTVCGEELQRATDLNKRIIPVLRRSVEGLPMPPALARPNWISARPEDDFDESIDSLVSALELDEAWVEQHARLSQRTGEWLRNDRDRSYLLRGSDLRRAERWLDEQGVHREAPTADQITYIIASRRAAARRQRGLLGSVALALVITIGLAIVALAQRSTAIHRERTARAQARAAQAIAALSRDPEASVRDALEAVDIRPDDPEAEQALRRAVSSASWTSVLRVAGSPPAALLDVEFAESGRRVATASENGTSVVWDTRTGQRVAVVSHRLRVNTVQFSPDGRKLLTASADGTARTWDSSTGGPLHVFETKSSEVWAATYGAAGRRILTVTPTAGQIWDPASGALLRRLKNIGRFQGTIRMSLNGRYVLTSASATTGDAWRWNLATRARDRLPGSGHDPLAFSLFSENGRRCVTFYASGALRVWDENKRLPIAYFGTRRVGAGFVDADLSRDGRRVLRADVDGSVDVWDVRSRNHVVLGKGGPVASAQFDRSGEFVVTGGYDGLTRVWRVRPRRLLAVLRGHTGAVQRARFSPEGTRVVTASADGSARLWLALPQTPADPRWQRADSATFSPSSRDLLVTRGTQRAVWNTVTGRVVPLDGGIYKTDSPTWPCGRAAGCSPWSPDGRFVAGATARGGAVIWDIHTGLVAHSFGKEAGTVIGVTFSPDGRRLLVVDADRPRAQIWNVQTGRLETEVPSLRAASEPLLSAQFVRNPLRVLTVDFDGNARLSDPVSGTGFSLGGTTSPQAVATDATGTHFAIGTSGGELRLFSSTGSSVRSRRTIGGPVTSLAFDRTGTGIVTGGQRGTASLWDTRTLTQRPLPAARDTVTAVTFSRYGNLVLVAAEAAASLWGRKLLRVILDLPQTPAIHAALSPDARWMVVAGATRLEILRCYACAPLGELVQHAKSLLPAS